MITRQSMRNASPTFSNLRRSRTARLRRRSAIAQRVREADLGHPGNVGGSAAPPNDGRCGNVFHYDRISRIVNDLRTAGYSDLRVEQPQTRANGKVAGTNHPDIQAIHPTTRERVVIEVDTKDDSRRQHIATVQGNDPNIRGVYILIDPNDGRVIDRRITRPGWRRASRRHRSPFNIFRDIDKEFNSYSQYYR